MIWRARRGVGEIIEIFSFWLLYTLNLSSQTISFQPLTRGPAGGRAPPPCPRSGPGPPRSGRRSPTAGEERMWGPVTTSHIISVRVPTLQRSTSDKKYLFSVSRETHCRWPVLYRGTVLNLTVLSWGDITVKNIHPKISIRNQDSPVSHQAAIKVTRSGLF